MATIRTWASYISRRYCRCSPSTQSPFTFPNRIPRKLSVAAEQNARPVPSPVRPKPPRRRQALQMVFWAVQGGCIMLLFQNYVAEITLCIGPSMLPTFNFAGDLLVVEHVSQMLGRPVKLGDVVACVSPTDPQRFLCKRILGLPGDTVAVDPVKWKQSHVTIPPGHIWLEGDNLNNSTDSRHYGPVSLGLLRGRILCKIWPDLEWVKNGLEEGPQVATSAAPVELQGFRS